MIPRQLHRNQQMIYRHNINKVLVLFLLMAIGSKAYTQQLTHFGMWSEARYLFNPAWTGTGEKLRMVGNYRSQWAGIQGHPQTYLVGVGTDIPVLQSGVGIVFERDQMGNRNFNTLTFQYNYHLFDSENLNSRVGVSANLRSFSLSTGNILTPEGVDGNLNDNFLNAYPGTVRLSQIGFGWANTWKGLQFGVSYLQGISNNTDSNGSYEAEPEIFIRGAYNFTLNKTLEVLPILVFYTNFDVQQLYTAVELKWNDRMFLGVGLRSLLENSEALTLSTGVQITSDVLLRYQYEVGLTGIAASSQGSHELVVYYEMDWTLGQWQEIPPIYSPRTY